MLDNAKLTRRLKRIFKELREKWGVTSYRIALESNIPHSSLKYMVENRFEWKLNHLLSILDFLSRNKAKVYLTELMDFDNKKIVSDYLDMSKADFRPVLTNVSEQGKKRRGKQYDSKKKYKIDAFHYETDLFFSEIIDMVKENPFFKNSRIDISVKIADKNNEYSKKFVYKEGKEIKV